MKRIYHPFTLWEERTAGMWRDVPKEEFDSFKIKTADLMRDCAAFKGAMIRAAKEWKYSCEHNLTDKGQNRKAWLGHAGCCLAVGSPEDATRAGWCTLTPDEQVKANQAADEAITWWEECQKSYSENPF